MFLNEFRVPDLGENFSRTVPPILNTPVNHQIERQWEQGSEHSRPIRGWISVQFHAREVRVLTLNSMPALN